MIVSTSILTASRLYYVVHNYALAQKLLDNSELLYSKVQTSRPIMVYWYSWYVYTHCSKRLLTVARNFDCIKFYYITRHVTPYVFWINSIFDFDGNLIDCFIIILAPLQYSFYEN